MKKFVLFFALVLGLSTFAVDASASFKIDDNQVESLFAAADEVSTSMMFDALDMSANASTATISAGKDPLVAILLDFFLGGLGIHRFYLGTKTMTGIGYILTCGGIFGLVPLIDLIVLAVNYDDISQFVDNPKFFMW
ncbi:TM2 domain-containing protein [Breznakibacter xylanolyticus]|uniref:TM2 domain-containing protein n=1 Tax=Breznakibacter xylanolyticus TaxID=990 RepID=A0A2W7NJI6_9BACT|nr:TM2 domain-containing protein [Breznakibacter xylanolyticus]PZX16874.1 TM2 domain-containing protein [Breznakibacter xylanolyticus]